MKKIFYKILFFIFYPFIKRNSKFKNKHSNEECYIIGNGKSLKYYNLADFNDKISIGVGAIFLHNDFKKLNLKYYFEGHPFFYYPIWKNPYTHKFEKNILGMFYKKKIIENNDIIFFTNLTNIFSMLKKNIYFLFHFGEKFKSFEECHIEKRFTTLNSSLAGALGIAINMGFKKITLVGCDYCMYPRSIGHFYENRYFIDYDDYDFNIQNKELLNQAQKKVLIDIIIPNDKYTAHDFDFVLYKKHSGNDPKYVENCDLVKNDYLNILDNSNLQYKIF